MKHKLQMRTENQIISKGDGAEEDGAEDEELEEGEAELDDAG
jgi:hypothetical protein